MTRPCLTCGEPSLESYCGEHQPKGWQHRVGSARERGYSSSWDKLSRRARRMQPFCTDCGATDDLQLDHTARTWERIEAGKVVRLRDTGGVVCGPCNRRRGAGRTRETHAETPQEGSKDRGAKAQGPLHIQPLQGAVSPDSTGPRAVAPVSPAGDRPAADGTAPGVVEQTLDPDAELPQVRLGGSQVSDPLGDEVAIEVVEAAVQLDRDAERVVANVGALHETEHGLVGIPVGRASVVSHVTSVSVTQAES